ncbi:rho guanine nucleotide exchange factor 28-like isoform X1, partial [Paramuricea clavata]
MIADQNRRPAHSRRLSCPGSFERQRRAAGGLPNLKSRPESSASERSTGNQEEPANPAAAETAFSIPPISPKVGQLVNLASPTVTSPGPEGTFQLFDDAPESFMTPPTNTPSPSPQPKSPMPISLKCSDAEKRPNTGRKGRPRTWYGGAADIPHVADEELRRSNSLEDFGKALDEGSDDESITSAASEANSKEGILQTLCSLTEKESRTESFVSSISDTSIGKESVGSDIEDDCELEYTQEGIQGEIVKDIEGYEGIQEREHEYTKDELEGHEEIGKGETHNHGDLGNVEVHLGIQEEEETGIHEVVDEHKDVDNRDVHENEKIEINGKLDQIVDVEKHESQITAGSNVKNNDGGDVENECQDTEYKCNDAEHDLKDTEHECRNSEHECIDTEQESKNTEEEFKDTLTEHECRNSEHECNDTEQESKKTEEEFKDTLMEHECRKSEHECNDTEQESKKTEEEFKDTLMEHECRNSEHECNDTEQESKKTEEEFKDTLMEHECRNSEHECNDTEQESKNTEEEFKDTLMEHECNETEHECKETEHECRDRNDLEHEQTEDTEAATNSNVEEDIVSRVDKQEENHESESPYENTYNGQQDNEVETGVVCNGVECVVQEHEHAEEHIQNEVIGDENMRNESMEKNTAVGTSGQGDCNKDLEEELSNDNKESQLNEEHQCGEPGLEPLEDVVQQDSHADPRDSENTASGENQLPHEDVSMENSSEEINLSYNSNDDAIVEETLTNKVADDGPEKNETSPEGNEDCTKESEGRSCGSEDVEEKLGCLQAEAENRPTESGNIERESEDRSAEPEDRPTEPENRQTEFEDRPTESENHSAESKNLPKESEDRTRNQANDPEIVIEDAEDKSSESTDDYSSVCQTKIKYEDLDDIECNVQDFCLPGQNTERNKELFRIQATDDVESGEDSDPGKHIRFDEKPPSLSPMAEELSPTSPEENFCVPMRTRSALLLGMKTPVKRSGSDISVTSLQDVELNMHATNRDNDLTPGVLNNSRKAKSFGDLSTFSEGRSEMTKDVGDDSDEERKRIQEDHTVLNRVKKYEQASKYASNEQLEQISTSRIITEREEEKQNQRRWSNFFNPKNPKPGKKPGRTPTFRRDNLRSSMTGKGSKNPPKSTIENLVAGPHSAAFAKHSQTAPNLHVAASGRPRSFTGSPGQIRKSPTISSIDSEEQKTESPDEVEIQNEDINFEVDSDLENFDKEPEAWSVTAEPYMLKKMKKNEIKRQDVILELIQTEGHHVRTLKIMQQVFYRGLHKVANYPEERLDELFPRINDLVDISARFYRNLRCRQDESASVKMIGDVIMKQFGGDNGELVKQAYGEFVSKHPEAVASYK